MATGAHTLADYPTDLVRFACRRCPRRGQIRKATLIGRHGGEVTLPDLRPLIAADCPRWRQLGTTCGIYFVDLAPPAAD